MINAVHPSIEAKIFSRDNESVIVVVNDDPMNNATELCCSNEHEISDCRRDILLAVALAHIPTQLNLFQSNPEAYSNTYSYKYEKWFFQTMSI